MTQKQIAIEVIEQLLDKASIEEIVEALRFREEVDKGLQDIDAGRVVSREEAKRRLAKWLPK